MTDPTENEREELSVDELKSVSGGYMRPATGDLDGDANPAFKFPEPDVDYHSSLDPKGSGSGLTKADFERANKARLVAGDAAVLRG